MNGSLENQNKTPAPAEGDERPAVSRRSFLRGLGAAAAVTAVGLESSPAAAQERDYQAERDRVYARGRIEMRLEAGNNSKEQIRLFVENGKEARWVELPEGGGTHSYVEFTPLKEALADADARVKMMHTHPRAVIERVAPGLSSEELRMSTMPPSFADIIGTLDFGDNLDPSGERLSHASVDERGVWEFSVDRNHPAVQEFVELRKKLREMTPKHSESIEFLKQYAGQDPRLAYMALFSANRAGKFSPEASSEIRAIEEMETAIFENPFVRESHKLEIESGVISSDAAIQKRIEELGKVGVKLSFVPH